MTWTTVVDLPMTRFQDHLALDSTDFGNHAQIVGAMAQPEWVAFEQPDDRLVIGIKDDSLQRFRGLRIVARIQPTALPHRLNIVEGWMSFAFYVEADQTLWGTVYDGANWVPVSSQAVVPLNEWSTVCFQFDGLSIGRLFLAGRLVGESHDLPAGMHQPQQNITVGHWPNGDGRYTFVGRLGAVHISRRDHEDFWRDTVLTMFCQNRRLHPSQQAAVVELQALIESLPADQAAELQNCLKRRSIRLSQILHRLRGGNPELVRAHDLLGRRLRAAWCCEGDTGKVQGLLVSYLRQAAGEPDSPQRQAFLAMIEELRELNDMCALPQGRVYDRIRLLLSALVPELAQAEAALEQILGMVQEGW